MYRALCHVSWHSLITTQKTGFRRLTFRLEVILYRKLKVRTKALPSTSSLSSSRSPPTSQRSEDSSRSKLRQSNPGFKRSFPAITQNSLGDRIYYCRSSTSTISTFYYRSFYTSGHDPTWGCLIYKRGIKQISSIVHFLHFLPNWYKDGFCVVLLLKLWVTNHPTHYLNLKRKSLTEDMWLEKSLTEHNQGSLKHLVKWNRTKSTTFAATLEQPRNLRHFFGFHFGFRA